MTIEEQIKEIVTRGYLAKPTGRGRAFPFMDTPEWEGFVKGCSDVQVHELSALFKQQKEKILELDEMQDEDEVSGCNCDWCRKRDNKDIYIRNKLRAELREAIRGGEK